MGHKNYPLKKYYLKFNGGSTGLVPKPLSPFMFIWGKIWLSLCVFTLYNGAKGLIIL